uniref:Uncharacterized protein LOC114341766 isoform X1 n=1 Tax=Diabrotica virgifera virgifera TaxID=50390 RepID=A0A6P7GFG6_DIAVI
MEVLWLIDTVQFSIKDSMMKIICKFQRRSNSNQKIFAIIVVIQNVIKHAIIVIHRNGVILQSANVNPTYFKSPVGVTVQMLHKDETLSLNTGDRLALVEDGVWFKIKIILEKNLDGGIMVDRYSAILNKRFNYEDNMQVPQKIKLEPEDVCNYCRNSECNKTCNHCYSQKWSNPLTC